MIDFEKHFTEYIKLFLSLLFLSVIVFPFVKEVWSKEHRKMEQDMKGENGRWEWQEIWEYHSLRIARGFFFTILFMVLCKTFFDTNYPWELYLMVFCGTLGSNGVSAFLIYLKSKNGGRDSQSSNDK